MVSNSLIHDNFNNMVFHVLGFFFLLNLLPEFTVQTQCFKFQMYKRQKVQKYGHAYHYIISYWDVCRNVFPTTCTGDCWVIDIQQQLHQPSGYFIAFLCSGAEWILLFSFLKLPNVFFFFFFYSWPLLQCGHLQWRPGVCVCACMRACVCGEEREIGVVV